MTGLFLTAGLALATPGFDATAPDARFTAAQTYTADGQIKLWSAIERLSDPDTTLLTPDAFNSATEWPANIHYAPHLRDCFGTARPGANTALLAMGLTEEVAVGTPILMVHGAGDNGSRAFVTMATRYDRRNRPVYVLTFAHPHGDAFKQAELVADAIARIRVRTGAEKVDVVAHSKGGIATAIYLSNAAETVWGHPAYETVGTRYRDDVRRAVFIAAPLAGTDTSYRWPGNNLAALDADSSLGPSSWSTYYPTGTATWWNAVDLTQQDYLSADGDLFPGQRQILARQPYALPGSNPTLGSYALQQDWYTTYEGGMGFVSYSEGIDAAIEDGGDLIATLAGNGVDPDVELYLLAGSNPVLSNGTDWVTELYGDAYADAIGSSADTWSEFIGDLVGEGLMEQGLTQAEVVGLSRGDLVLGEITGESDGVVFVSSATAEAALTARGAVVVESKVVDLSHLDLLYASPITGNLLIESAASEDGEPWMAAFGERYIEADTLGWVERVLADEPGGDPENPDRPDDQDDPLNSDTGTDEAGLGNCGCSAAHSRVLWWLLIPSLIALRGRGRR